MASNTTTSNSIVKGLGVAELKDAGVKSLQLGLAATVTVFAVQAAIVAGKVLLANGKGLADSLKA